MRLERGVPVLIAVDFSDGSIAAFEWALDFAEAVVAPLLVLHVAHDPPDDPGSYAGRGETRPIEEVARERLDAFLEAQLAKPAAPECSDLRKEVVVGLPVNRILEVAEREGVQAIVIGAKGRTALADVLLGSKAERVVHLSPVPVVVAKTAHRTSSPEER